MVLCLVTLTDLWRRRAGLSASSELLVVYLTCLDGKVVLCHVFSACMGHSYLTWFFWCILCDVSFEHVLCHARVWYSLLMSRVARCPVLNWTVRFWSDLSGWKFQLEPGTDNIQIYTVHMYTDPDPQFLAAARSLEIGQECPVFRRADLATLLMHVILEYYILQRESCCPLDWWRIVFE